MKYVVRAAGLVAAGLFACVAACGSSSSGNNSGNNGGCNGSTALQMMGGNAMCSSCVQSNCSSQLSAFESGCSSAIQCLCSMNGATDASLSGLQMCLSDFNQSSCTSATSPLSMCETSSCASQCMVTSSSGGPVDSGSTE